MTIQEILQGVHDWTNGKIVYDISVAHPDGQGNPTPYADLAAALGNGGANIPEAIRKGGMSIKFVQSSDNKYIQARCMAQNFTTDTTQWQVVDDEPTANSNNLVKSGGVFPVTNAVNKSLIPINGKVSIIGDSISTFAGTMPSGYPYNYPDSTLGVTSIYDMWWHLLLSLTNSKLEVNASYSGSRVTNGLAGGGYPDFYDRTNILGSPDYIFVELGTNDSGGQVALGDYDYDSENLSESKFIPAYIKGVKALKANYPNAKIVLFVFQMANSYANAIKNIGKHYELDVIDVRSYYKNNVHPNKLQMCSVAQTINSFYIRGKVDDEPTAGSDNLVKSGGVQNELALGAVYDVSAKNPTAGPTNDGKWDSLSVLLSDDNLETLVPPAYRKGGMSIKFICNADNEYEQYRYMGTAIDGTPNPFLDVLNWQKNTEKYINDSKYLYIIKDDSDKLLLAIDAEANVVFGNGCPKQIKKLIEPLLDFLLNFFSETEEDIKERLELTLDQNDNLLSWRDKDGTKHEAVFAAGKYVFSDANKRQLVNALKDVNYGNQTDWSDASNIAIPIPRCAKINVTNISSMPTTKTTNSRAIVQFWDMQGNTFTKTAILNAQGQHSMGDPKKNISIDLHDHNWDGDFTVKFGDWVPQSSFHIKSYWLDWSRVVGPVNYDIIEQVDKSRGILKDRSWKRALMTSSVTANSDLDVRMDTGAKCHPMGFPCIVYLNGEFYGIFIWQLKKHRDNYHMEKDNPNHIHVEGLNLSRGDFSWTVNEIRNPKYLVYAEKHSGTYEYDGDVAVAEIAGEKDGTVASEYSDSTTYTKGALCTLDGRMFMSLADNNIGNTPVACTKPKNVFKNATDYWIDVTFTNTVKQSILRAASYYSEISAAATTEAKMALIEQYYDIDNIIDIALEIAATRDSDYIANVQSTTWDGVKWYLNAYDKDRSFGISFGTHVNPPSVGSLPSTGAFNYLPLYKQRTKDRWLELVDKGIFTLDNIMGILNDWMQRIGYENYKLENDKWPPQGEYILDTVERLYHFIEQNLEVQNEFMENFV